MHTPTRVSGPRAQPPQARGRCGWRARSAPRSSRAPPPCASAAASRLDARLALEEVVQRGGTAGCGRRVGVRHPRAAPRPRPPAAPPRARAPGRRRRRRARASSWRSRRSPRWRARTGRRRWRSSTRIVAAVLQLQGQVEGGGARSSSHLGGAASRPGSERPAEPPVAVGHGGLHQRRPAKGRAARRRSPRCGRRGGARAPARRRTARWVRRIASRTVGVAPQPEAQGEGVGEEADRSPPSARRGGSRPACRAGSRLPPRGAAAAAAHAAASTAKGVVPSARARARTAVGERRGELERRLEALRPLHRGPRDGRARARSTCGAPSSCAPPVRRVGRERRLVQRQPLPGRVVAVAGGEGGELRPRARRGARRRARPARAAGSRWTSRPRRCGGWRWPAGARPRPGAGGARAAAARAPGRRAAPGTRRRASAPSPRARSSSRSARSAVSHPGRGSADAVCTGSPSRSDTLIRSASWRATSARRAASSAGAARAPRSAVADGDGVERRLGRQAVQVPDAALLEGERHRPVGRARNAAVRACAGTQAFQQRALGRGERGEAVRRLAHSGGRRGGWAGGDERYRAEAEGSTFRCFYGLSHAETQSRRGGEAYFLCGSAALRENDFLYLPERFSRAITTRFLRRMDERGTGAADAGAGPDARAAGAGGDEDRAGGDRRPRRAADGAGRPHRAGGRRHPQPRPPRRRGNGGDERPRRPRDHPRLGCGAPGALRLRSRGEPGGARHPGGAGDRDGGGAGRGRGARQLLHAGGGRHRGRPPRRAHLHRRVPAAGGEAARRRPGSMAWSSPSSRCATTAWWCASVASAWATGSNDTDPLEIGLQPVHPQGEDEPSRRTARYAAELLPQARTILADEYPANYLLLRGFSALPHFPPFGEVYGVRAAALALYPTYRGPRAAGGDDGARRRQAHWTRRWRRSPAMGRARLLLRAPQAHRQRGRGRRLRAQGGGDRGAGRGAPRHPRARAPTCWWSPATTPPRRG